MRMNSANGCVTEILHITIWAGGSVPLFSKMAKCASRGALRTSAKCANAPQKERLPPTRQYTRACKCGVFSMQHCSLTMSNPQIMAQFKLCVKVIVTPMSCCSWKS